MKREYDSVVCIVKPRVRWRKPGGGTGGDPEEVVADTQDVKEY